MGGGEEEGERRLDWCSQSCHRRTYLMPDLSHLNGILTFSFWMPFIIKHSQNVSKVGNMQYCPFYFIPQNLLTGHILLKRSDMCISHGTKNCVCDMKELLEITKNNI